MCSMLQDCECREQESVEEREQHEEQLAENDNAMRKGVNVESMSWKSRLRYCKT